MIFINKGNSYLKRSEGYLNPWSNNQRREYKKQKLSKEKIDLLEKINFIWDPTEYQWNEKFKELKAYFAINGNTSVPLEQGSLYAWCANQREDYRKEILPKEKIDLLEEVDFIWDPIDHLWNKNYEELKLYFEKTGHTLVKDSKTTLGIWCKTQRKALKSKSISKARINLLEKINFVWDVYEHQWNQNYEKLQSYFQTNGHSSISKNEDNLLSSWRKNQVNKYNNGKLSQEQINKLEKIKFIWDTKEDLWDNNYQKLKELYNTEGYTKVSCQTDLIYWQSRQRKLYKEGKLTKEKIDKLEKINFTWDLLEQNRKNWIDNYQYLKEFYIKEGCYPSTTTNTSIGNWISRQRKLYKEGKLNQERIDLLESIQFKWQL